MKIDCISDLHGFFPILKGGDLLIISGDLTARDTEEEHALFIKWANEQDYRKIVFISGNHDFYLEKESERILKDACGKIEYLCDSETSFEGLNIWGTPWSLSFEGQNEQCMAFCKDTENELREIWKDIPSDIDILITHCPPFGILDHRTKRHAIRSSFHFLHCNSGSIALKETVFLIQPKLHCFGHIHQSYGKITQNDTQFNIRTIFVNASQVTEFYEPDNEPITVEL